MAQLTIEKSDKTAASEDVPRQLRGVARPTRGKTAGSECVPQQSRGVARLSLSLSLSLSPACIINIIIIF